MGSGLLEDREDEDKDYDNAAAADDDDDDIKVLFPLHATVYVTFLLTRT